MTETDENEISLLNSLAKLEETENLFLQDSKKGLADVLEFVERLDLLYSISNKYISEKISAEIPTSQQMLFLQTSISSKRQFLQGILTLMRGQVSDSFGYLRKAIEFTLFAAQSVQDEESALAWLSAPLSEENWKEYRKKFKIYQMTDVAKSHIYWSKLIDELQVIQPLLIAYDITSRRVHATIHTAGPYFVDGGEKDWAFSQAPIDFYAFQNPETIVEPFLFTIGVHLQILLLHKRIIVQKADLGSFPHENWNHVYTLVLGDFEATKILWESKKDDSSEN